jgi:hypothetical protein
VTNVAVEANPTLMRLRELEVVERVAASGKLNIALGEKGLAERVVNLPSGPARTSFPPGRLYPVQAGFFLCRRRTSLCKPGIRSYWRLTVLGLQSRGHNTGI